MATEVLKLAAEIVVSHASMSELTSAELVEEIKDIYNVLSSLEAGVMVPEIFEAEPGKGEIRKPQIPLKDIVKEKYVVCLECGKKMRILKTHIKKAHGLTPKEYYQRYDLDPKKYPLVCKEYSAQRSQMARDRGFGKEGGRRKATS
jgi:predicted transcriptional regulator